MTLSLSSIETEVRKENPPNQKVFKTYDFGMFPDFDTIKKVVEEFKEAHDLEDSDFEFEVSDDWDGRSIKMEFLVPESLDEYNRRIQGLIKGKMAKDEYDYKQFLLLKEKFEAS